MIPTTLDISESATWIVGLLVGVGQLAVNLVFAVVIAQMNRKTQQIDRLQGSLEQRADAIIEFKLSGVASHLEGVINVINERVSNIRERLVAGDESLSGLDQRDRELETRFNLRFDQMKDYLHKNFATKDDARLLHNRIDVVKQQINNNGSAA